MDYFFTVSFFSHSVGIDGRVYVWKISEGPDEEDKAQITGRVLVALQIVGEEEASNPRICWHCHKQVISLIFFISKAIFLYLSASKMK